MGDTIKFVHIGDVHLDTKFSKMTEYSIDGGTKADTLRDGIKQAFCNVVKYCTQESIDVLLIAGDLYEGKWVCRSTVEFLNNTFKSCKNTEICIVPGNHDPAIDSSFYKTFEWASNIHILTRENPVYENLQKEYRVYGVGFYDYHIGISLVSLIDNITRDKFANILVYHGDVDVENSRYSSTTSSELINLHMDYIAMGHIHSTILNNKGVPNCNYSGVLQPLSFADTEATGAICGSITKKDDLRYTCCEHRIFNTIRYITERLDIGYFESYEDTIAKLRDCISNIAEPYRNPIRISLCGTRKMYKNAEITRLERELSAEFFYITIVDNLQIDYSFDELDTETGITQQFIAICKDSISKLLECKNELSRLLESEEDTSKKLSVESQITDIGIRLKLESDIINSGITLLKGGSL